MGASSRLLGGEEINPELLRSRPFPHPNSMPALRAIKTAEILGGMAAHAKMYNRLQHTHFVEARDISDPQTPLGSQTR